MAEKNTLRFSIPSYTHPQSELVSFADFWEERNGLCGVLIDTGAREKEFILGHSDRIFTPSSQIPELSPNQIYTKGVLPTYTTQLTRENFKNSAILSLTASFGEETIPTSVALGLLSSATAPKCFCGQPAIFSLIAQEGYTSYFCEDAFKSGVDKDIILHGTVFARYLIVATNDKDIGFALHWNRSYRPERKIFWADYRRN